ncbi:hypothetical protein AJ85_09485 [Alkalihalobacillus alcalophilus ATCC 27647 = CGMCC 1.3604]|uniref:Competence protein ComG n=1 Tax=Alkalihalobacillus alcalophilus ATCC 27647 = CGMCC 1.3604 TaxID=1218173 RepID=A0A094XAV4_ALKAL|nr:competence type IV pilus minor pilin ComGD [Alkalihalobacillus alcalophilus]KGA95910.1 hypothetical protein BALCAV_0219565 [Alkalihalobacillus alcalophilus ATCC 27647 = CGMCC 1.3604]MED1562876.1 competence type IV pilus minor pilin ComGD [Alkalihalobacillus alcalophilus]THG90671.1 hypothetical protein AJ85_09485 [Alkalihalobacillus alcalophilus ATCC 27647 = CGMCC 1.3604]
MKITNKNWSSTGFTLIELLLVLSIISILLFVPLLFTKSFQYEPSPEQVAESLREDLLLAQHIAMSKGSHINFVIDNLTKKYVIRYGAFDTIVEKPYAREDMSIYFFSTINNNNISFNRNGHPRISGSFRLEVGGERFIFTIYLGKGWVEYKKM